MAGFRSVEHSQEPAGPVAPDAAPQSEIIGATPATKASVPIEKSDRPAWLPEKFKSAEDLAAAYSALESKMGQAPVKDVPAPTPADKAKLEIAPKSAEEFNPDNFIDQYTSEYMDKGTLSEDSYKALAAKGYTKRMVDSFIAGQQAIVEQGRNQVFSMVGGEQNYSEMVQWAASNLDKSEIEAFNKAVTSGDGSMITMAVNGLNARFKGAQGPKLLQGTTQGAEAGFASRSELAKAVADPRYNADPEYRRKVTERLQASRF
jgi:Phage T7 capsid assembly protein